MTGILMIALNYTLRGFKRCANHSSKSLISYSRAEKIRCIPFVCTHQAPKVVLSKAKTCTPSAFQIE